jgi:uncharacterized membrane protein YwaF
VIITTGKRDVEVLQYLKSVAFHQWLFGIEVAGVQLSTSFSFVMLSSSCGCAEQLPVQSCDLPTIADIVIILTKTEMRILTFEGKKGLFRSPFWTCRV